MILALIFAIHSDLERGVLKEIRLSGNVTHRTAEGSFHGKLCL